MKVNGHVVKTITQAHKHLLARHFTAMDLADECWSNIDKNAHLNAFVTKRAKEDTMREAEAANKRYQEGTSSGPLDGVPIAIKDNIFVKGLQASAASKALKGFIAPVDATTTRRLKSQNAIVMGTANMDEFGMGSYGEQGYDGTMVKNPINPEYFPGGSSAGSAASVGSYQVLGSIGTDTGGSIGQPSHCCGLFGLKPSFGRASRFGKILYSSSQDVNGPLCHSALDVYHMFHAIQGADEADSNCVDFSTLNPSVYRDADKSRVLDTSCLDLEKETSPNLKGITVGVVEEFQIRERDDRNRSVQRRVLELMEEYGAEVKVISLPLFKYVLPYHYSLLPSEAASNMARYDGIRYGYQPEIFEKGHNEAAADPQSDLFEFISRTKTAAFGINVKRRVVLGNFLMSSGHGNENFNQNLVNA
jgi:aspartyl-tRNA(Asn)/glutamyl-tRNA(Gln) amidotransferase subunit A